MNEEKQLFEKALNKTNSFLKVTGLHFIEHNGSKGFLAYLRRRWYLCFVFICVNTDICTEILWLIDGIRNEISMAELFYATPGLALWFLGSVKSLFFIINECHVNDLINTLRMMQSTDDGNSGKDEKEVKFNSVRRIQFLTRATNIQFLLNAVGTTTFAIIPFTVMASSYYKTGEVKFVMPFPVLYPFDIYNIRIWPFMYVRQMFTALWVVLSVFGPDCFYYMCCTFIQIQFNSLRYEMSSVMTGRSNEMNARIRNSELFSEFRKLVKRHNEILRCVSLMEHVYSMSTLFNVVTSSFLICLNAFNATVNTDDLTIMLPFVAFLVMVSIQIFLLCYFGELIMRSSIEVSDLVNNCQWYNAEISMMKDLLFVITRAQRPSKLTAYGFSDIKIGTFTRILSTAWSYFALLKSVGNP